MKLKDFVHKQGRPYSRMLGIDLKSCRNKEVVKWFLAAILYSKPIRESTATRTFRCFDRQGLTTARRIIEAGWDRLVSILDEGGYTRYDFSTADKLLEVFGNLQEQYGGNLNRLYEASRDGEEVEANLKRLGKGIGDITVSIFLRDMRSIWKKVEPKPTPLVIAAMKSLAIKDLKECAREKRIDLVRLETALLRYSKDFLKKRKTVKILP
jgi:hypothetical protein